MKLYFISKVKLGMRVSVCVECRLVQPLGGGLVCPLCHAVAEIPSVQKLEAQRSGTVVAVVRSTKGEQDICLV